MCKNNVPLQLILNCAGTPFLLLLTVPQKVIDHNLSCDVYLNHIRSNAVLSNLFLIMCQLGIFYCQYILPVQDELSLLKCGLITKTHKRIFTIRLQLFTVNYSKL